MGEPDNGGQKAGRQSGYPHYHPRRPVSPSQQLEKYEWVSPTMVGRGQADNQAIRTAVRTAQSQSLPMTGGILGYIR